MPLDVDDASDAVGCLAHGCLFGWLEPVGDWFNYWLSDRARQILLWIIFVAALAAGAYAIWHFAS